MGRFKNKTRKKVCKKIAKPQEAPILQKLMRDVSLSLKKRKLFGDFIANYSPIPKEYLKSNEPIDDYLSNLRNATLSLPIGKNVDDLIYKRYRYESSKTLYETLFGRMMILSLVLNRYQHSNVVPVGAIMESYAADEFAKIGRKSCPNVMVLQTLIGSIFTVIGMALLLISIWIFFSVGVAFVVSFIWTFVLFGLYNKLTRINKKKLDI